MAAGSGVLESYKLSGSPDSSARLFGQNDAGGVIRNSRPSGGLLTKTQENSVLIGWWERRVRRFSIAKD